MQQRPKADAQNRVMATSIPQNYMNYLWNWVCHIAAQPNIQFLMRLVSGT